MDEIAEGERCVLRFEFCVLRFRFRFCFCFSEVFVFDICLGKGSYHEMLIMISFFFSIDSSSIIFLSLLFISFFRGTYDIIPSTMTTIFLYGYIYTYIYSSPPIKKRYTQSYLILS